MDADLYNRIVSQPGWKNLPPDQQKAALEAAGLIGPTPMATPTPVPGTLAKVGYPPSAGATPSGPMDLAPESPQNQSILTPYTRAIEAQMSRTKQKMQDIAAQPALSTGAAGISGLTLSTVASNIPDKVPEAVGDALLMAMPESEGLLGLAERIAGPPIGAALASMASGSGAGPGASAFYTGVGSLGGEVLGAGQRLALGGIHSRRIAQILRDDLTSMGAVMGHDMSDIMPRDLSTPAEFIDHFHKSPEQLPFVREKYRGQALLDEYHRKEALMEHLREQADNLAAGTSNMPPNLQQYHSGPNSMRQTRINKLRADADAIAQLQTRGQMLIDSFERKSEMHEALRPFFGNKANYEGFGEGYRELLLNTAQVQDYLGKSENVQKLRDAGFSEEAIDNMKRVAYRQPGAAANKIISQTDVGATPWRPGIRGHWYHGLPRPITHFDLPRPAKLAGTGQARITPNPMWRKMGSPLMSRIMYGIFGTEYGDEPPDASLTANPSTTNTAYPTPAATPRR